MIRLIYALILLLLSLILPMLAGAAPQQTLSLADCMKLAEENYPLRKQIEMQTVQSKLATDELNSAFYPEISLFGNAQWQSDVTKVDINLTLPNGSKPEFPSPAKDQYKIGISANQLIYDGGTVAARISAEHANELYAKSSVDVELFKLRSRISDLYFGVLKIRLSISSIDTLAASLRSKLETIESAVRNGAMLESNALIIQAELKKLAQSREDLLSLLAAQLRMLSELAGRDIAESMLALPNLAAEPIDANSRLNPEFKAFDKSRQLLEVSKQSIDASVMPKVSAFAQAYYGRPGLNMFDNDFAPAFIVGIKASFPLFNWGTPDVRREQLDVRSRIIDCQEETFKKNRSVQLAKQQTDLEKFDRLIAEDDEIIDLRDRIATQYESQLGAGIITASEFVSEKNNAASARLNRELHRIDKLKARADIILTLGGTKY